MTTRERNVGKRMSLSEKIHQGALPLERWITMSRQRLGQLRTTHHGRTISDSLEMRHCPTGHLCQSLALTWMAGIYQPVFGDPAQGLFFSFLASSSSFLTLRYFSIFRYTFGLFAFPLVVFCSLIILLCSIRNHLEWIATRSFSRRFGSFLFRVSHRHLPRISLLRLSSISHRIPPSLLDPVYIPLRSG